MQFVTGSDIEFIALNVTDPWNEVDGERASVKSKHPAFSDKAVRDAMAC
jgi:peptide/nickel transport system substrate-binding protein